MRTEDVENKLEIMSDVDNVYPSLYGTFASANHSSSNIYTPNVVRRLSNASGNNIISPSVPSVASVHSPSFSVNSRYSTDHPRSSHRMAIDNIYEYSHPAMKWTPVSAWNILYFVSLALVLFADTIQMLVLYSTMKNWIYLDIVIYGLCPLFCFLFLQLSLYVFEIAHLNLLSHGYAKSAAILRKYGHVLYRFGSIAFALSWLTYIIVRGTQFSFLRVSTTLTLNYFMTHSMRHSIIISIFVATHYIQIAIISLTILHCIQHNNNPQPPDHYFESFITNNNNKNKHNHQRTNSNYSIISSNKSIMSVDGKTINGSGKTKGKSSKRKNKSKSENKNTIKWQNPALVMHKQSQKISILERQLASISRELLIAKQNSIHMKLSNSENEDGENYEQLFREKCQSYRVLSTERDLLKSEIESKKSQLTSKRQQCKQQQHSIKQMQQMREENMEELNQLRTKFREAQNEQQKLRIMLQIERQNVQKAQEFFEHIS